MKVDYLDDIIKDVLAGDREAYRTIVESCESNVRLILSCILPDKDLIEDQTQEVFITAYINLYKYEIGTDFLAWLKAVARNHALNARRSWFRRINMENDFCDQVQIEETIDDEVEMLSEELGLNVSESLRHCIDGLADNAKNIINSYYFNQQTSSVIAKQYDRPAGWVRLVLHRGRIALAKCLRQKGVTQYV